MNHHTGQDVVAGYVKKVLDVFYKDQVSKAMMSAAHSLEHFTNTLKVLRIAGVQGLLCVPITIAESALILFQDAKLRFQSMPAGTHSKNYLF